MTTSGIKEILHQYIDESDDRLLKLLYAVAKEYNEDDEYIFTEEDIKEFDNRRQKRLNSESQTFSWNEARNMITKKPIN